MTLAARPVLSVIVRRFPKEAAGTVETSIAGIQKAAAEQPGFISLHNKVTPKRHDTELVTVITFDTQAHLEKWERSAVRKVFIQELDALSQDHATTLWLDRLNLLVSPRARVSKLETVIVLIAWILTLTYLLRHLLDRLPPAPFSPFVQTVLQTTLIVVLISYVFLPCTSVVLSRLKSGRTGGRGH